MDTQQTIELLLNHMQDQQASDMYLSIGYPPALRVNNKITHFQKRTLSDQDILNLLEPILGESLKKKLAHHKELNFSYKTPDGLRFRFNVFFQQNTLSAVIRRINLNIPSISSLGLPKEYAELIMRKQGLIILASPSGSGKSASMAAMIQHRNHSVEGHILTIEDPIEFVHMHSKSIISQREVGNDTLSYENALKNALRQRADVIAVGEVRDAESMQHVLRFAETGHLAITTLHSNNTVHAIERMINFFPEESHANIRYTLSQNLLGIFSQKLVQSTENKRMLIVEMMQNRGLITNLIRDAKTNDIKEVMETNKNLGMQSFDQALFEAYKAEKISFDTALNEAENPSNFKLRATQKGMAFNDMQVNNNEF